MNHTPTPWEWVGDRAQGFILLGPDGSIGEVYICAEPSMCNAQANAAFIVRAVNAHDDLIGALKTIEAAHPHIINRESPSVCVPCVAKKAIAKAEGK